MADVAEPRRRFHWQLTNLLSPGLVRRKAAYWSCCDLTLLFGFVGHLPSVGGDSSRFLTRQAGVPQT